MKTFLAAILFCASLLRADIVTGLVQTAGIQFSTGTKIIFTPTNTLANIGGVGVRSQPVECLVSSNGWFSNTLAGPLAYRVSVGNTLAYPRDVFMLYTLGDGGTYDWFSLTTNTSLANTSTIPFIVRVQVNGTNVGAVQYPTVNLIPGANTTMNATNNAASNRLDIRVSSTGGGGGGSGNITSINGDTTADAIIAIGTNSFQPRVTNDAAGTTTIVEGWAGMAGSGNLHSNDYQFFVGKLSSNVWFAAWGSLGTNAVTAKLDSNFWWNAWGSLSSNSITAKLDSNVWWNAWGSLDTNSITTKLASNVWRTAFNYTLTNNYSADVTLKANLVLNFPADVGTHDVTLRGYSGLGSPSFSLGNNIAWVSPDETAAIIGTSLTLTNITDLAALAVSSSFDNLLGGALGYSLSATNGSAVVGRDVTLDGTGALPDVFGLGYSIKVRAANAGIVGNYITNTSNNTLDLGMSDISKVRIGQEVTSMRRASIGGIGNTGTTNDPWRVALTNGNTAVRVDSNGAFGIYGLANSSMYLNDLTTLLSYSLGLTHGTTMSNLNELAPTNGANGKHFFVWGLTNVSGGTNYQRTPLEFGSGFSLSSDGKTLTASGGGGGSTNNALMANNVEEVGRLIVTNGIEYVTTTLAYSGVNVVYDVATQSDSVLWVTNAATVLRFTNSSPSSIPSGFGVKQITCIVSNTPVGLVFQTNHVFTNASAPVFIDTNAGAISHIYIKATDNPTNFVISTATNIQPRRQVAASSSGGGGGSPTYILEENWEGANAVTSGTGSADLTGWTASAASMNADISTAGLSLEASHCLQGGAGETVWHSFTGSSEIWLYRQFRKTANAPANFTPIFTIYNSVPDDYCEVVVRDSDTLTDTLCVNFNGGSVSKTVDTLANNTTYGIWVHVTVNGSSSTITAGFSSDGTEPTSGNAFISKTGTLTGNRARLYITGWGAGTGYADKIRVATTSIGNNPP